MTFDTCEEYRPVVWWNVPQSGFALCWLPIRLRLGICGRNTRRSFLAARQEACDGRFLLVMLTCMTRTGVSARFVHFVLISKDYVLHFRR